MRKELSEVTDVIEELIQNKIEQQLAESEKLIDFYKDEKIPALKEQLAIVMHVAFAKNNTEFADVMKDAWKKAGL